MRFGPIVLLHKPNKTKANNLCYKNYYLVEWIIYKINKSSKRFVFIACNKSITPHRHRHVIEQESSSQVKKNNERNYHSIAESQVAAKKTAIIAKIVNGSINKIQKIKEKITTICVSNQSRKGETDTNTYTNVQIRRCYTNNFY